MSSLLCLLRVEQQVLPAEGHDLGLRVAPGQRRDPVRVQTGAGQGVAGVHRADAVRAVDADRVVRVLASEKDKEVTMISPSMLEKIC